jgi:membrane fusion protein (multidrug efflux system)
MTRRGVTLASAAALAVLLVAFLTLPSSCEDPPAGATPGGAEERPLQAEIHVAAVGPVTDVVRTVGTLAANESVNVVAELSRRLVKVHVAEGTPVAQGALLFTLDGDDLRAQLAELEVRRGLASLTEQRQRELLEYDEKALSQQAYDQAVAELRTVEAQIAALRVTLAKTEIRAPFRGMVGLRRVSEGAWITPDTLLTTLQDTSRIKIDFTLPERYAGAVAIGQRFQFRVEGRAEDFSGEVAALEPVIAAATRSLLVRGVTENPSGALLPGAFASVELPVEKPSTGILLPAQALVPSATGQAVYVVSDGRAELREVEVGLRTRDSVEILRGIRAGDQVVTSNLLRVRPGARVERADAG